ncbi:helix-turn-helix domain-containing protein [Rhizobium sp. G21]|uniref:AlbA family DNA-binding domain-containing protein n=1 Tax=Rhizobium sp. G21 TaxID=2758439 RepID=UPI001AEE8BD9|nr:RNA-binding domain-containing protein [Rhizobium sp. G21]
MCYDFKCGLQDLRSDVKKQPDDIEKILKTPCAMHNSHIGSSYVLLGVADNHASASQHEKVFGARARVYDEFHIVGVGEEAKKLHRDLDAYQQYIFQKIEAAKIDEAVKRNITRNVKLIRYYEKDVVVFKIDRMPKPAMFDGNVYVRKFANVDPKPVDQASLFEFFEEFKHQGQQYPYATLPLA